MPQRKAEAWPPFMLEILVVFRYTTRFPDRFKCLSGDKFITRLVRRGLLKGIDEQPYFELTSKGDAAVERILSAATAIADRIAPAPPPPHFVTAKARISYPHLRDPNEWKIENSNGKRYIAATAIRQGDVVHFDSTYGYVRPSKLSDPLFKRYRAKEDIAKGDPIRWNVHTRGVRVAESNGAPLWINPIKDIGTPVLKDEPAGSIYIDRATDKVYSKHWCHGVPYWLPVTPYESFAQSMFRKIAESVGIGERKFGGTLRDNLNQARGASHLMQAREAIRPGLGRAMHVPGGVFGAENIGDNIYVIDHAWLDLYDRFKAIGTKCHEQGRLTRREWKLIFDAVFIRTKKLTNVRLAKQILGHLRIEAREGNKRVFGPMYSYAVNTKVPT